MISRARRHRVLIGFLLLFVVVVLVRRSGPDPPAEPAAPPSNPAVRTPQGQRGTGAGTPVADVRLEALDAARNVLPPAERNPFRFRTRQAPPSPVSAAPSIARTPPAPVASTPLPPAGPPPPPPIPLRFIGFVEQRGGGRVAVLSDGRGSVFHGKEGDIIEGRYRVIRIGTDSAEMAYLDGRGRQTIRLSGQ